MCNLVLFPSVSQHQSLALMSEVRSARPVSGFRQPDRQKERGEAEEGGGQGNRKDIAGKMKLNIL